MTTNRPTPHRNRLADTLPKKPPEAFRALAAAYKCAECDSEASEPIAVEGEGIWRLEVRHDESCRWYRRKSEKRNR